MNCIILIMCKIFLTLLLVSFLGVIQANIAAGCAGNKTCYQFSDCTTTASPSTPNLATIYTTGENTVEFELQYNNTNAGWIAIGLSDTQSMPDTYVFMCVRPNSSSVNVQERFASARSRPPITTSYLTTVSTINEGSLFKCTFTSPVTRTPMLNDITGYYVLLAWGAYSSGDIRQHANPAGRCVTGARMQITDAPGVQTTIAAGCGNGKKCYQFSDCSQTTNPTTPNLATIYDNTDGTVEFQLQYNNVNAGWMAIGLSDDQMMADSYIFMCVRPDSTNVEVQQRFAEARARPPLRTSILTEVNSFNNGTSFNCTFTAPVDSTPLLTAENGYFLLLAWGPYNNDDIQQHGGAGVGRCATSSRVIISDAPIISVSFYALVLMLIMFIFV